MPVRAPRLSVLRLLAAGWLVLPPAIDATTYVVDSELDEIDIAAIDGNCETANGECTLRAAVMQANYNNTDTTIELPAGTYTITRQPSSPYGDDNGDFDLESPSPGPKQITITGAGAKVTIIDAQDRDRIFYIASDLVVIISGVTLRNGSSGGGGAILNAGALALADSVLELNESADKGGAILNYSGLTIDGCRLTGNNALGTGGGAIFNDSTDDLYLSFSELSDNHATTGDGGAIYVNDGDVIAGWLTISGNDASNFGGGIYKNASGKFQISRSEVSGNASLGGAGGGGGIWNDGAGDLEVYESTISGNHSAVNGGGILNGSREFIVNSTISGNSSDDSGAGIFNAGETWTYNATIAFNQADVNGGGVYNDSGTFNPRNSVIAGNIGAGALDNDCYKVTGTFTGFGYNKFGPVDDCRPDFGHAGACNGTDTNLASLSELGPLQYNGGLTKTHAIAADSGMVDGVIGTCICQGPAGELLVDQRGGERPTGTAGARCDIGAFEYAGLPSNLIFADDFELENLYAWN